MSVAWPQDPRCWIDRLARSGGIERTLHEDWTTPPPVYMSEADKQVIIQTFRANKFVGPTCWYKAVVRGLSPEDDQGEIYPLHSTESSPLICLIPGIPEDRTYPPAGTPIFFGAAKHDCICIPSDGYEVFKNEHFAEGQVTTKEYDADHWLILSKASDISRDLEAWIKGFSG